MTVSLRQYWATQCEMEKRLKTLTATVGTYIQAQQYDKALAMERQLIEHCHDTKYLFHILKSVRPSVEELKDENSAIAWTLLGWMYCYGAGGVRRDVSRGYGYFCKSADMGCAFAMYHKGNVLITNPSPGIQSSAKVRFLCFQNAVKAGNSLAYYPLGIAYKNGAGTTHSYRHAALCFLKCPHAQTALSSLQCMHPFACCPFGYWVPDCKLQTLVPRLIANTLRVTMLVCHRIGMDRNVAQIIVSYVCTVGSEWNNVELSIHSNHAL